MTDGHDAIVALIDAAKRLRATADKLGDVETKAQILDVLVDLQELRELEFHGESAESIATETQTVSEQSTAELPVTAPAQNLPAEQNHEPARLEPSGEIETYTFAQQQPEEANESSADGDTPDTPAAGSTDGKQAGADGAKRKRKKPPAPPTEMPADDELTEEKRFAIAEQRIAELEPLHQAALKRMNEVLSPEQAARKAAATKKGLAAGLRGKQLQDAVFAVLDLTDEQQQQLEKGRNDLHRVRLAIGKQVEDLLSKEQIDRLLRSHRH